MKRSILDYLEASAEKNYEKTIFVSEESEINYFDFIRKAKIIGSFLNEKQKIAIYIDKSINCLVAMFGAMYCNACYTVIDIHSPQNRLESIILKFQPDCIIVDQTSYPIAKKAGLNNLVHLETVLEGDILEKKLSDIRKRMIDTDPLYVLFTSGSTGAPKGTVICHRSVIDYTISICETFGIDDNTIWGSQTPLYFSMSILDVFSTVFSGATLCIIPKSYFSFPECLINYLDSKRINTIYWVPTAMSIIADLDVFSECKPSYLRKVLFAGEVMPVKKLNYWINHLPDCLYANLYGPTEITDTCTYYIINRHFNDDETLPIGVPFDNCDVLIIDENNELITSPEEGIGELYVRGSFLGMGYYNDPDKTNSAFIQNPLNTSYPEPLYRTGDLVEYNDRHELIYKGRKDYQIKHMGHRIELGEIETAALSQDEIDMACCLYDYNTKHIVLFYSGLADVEKVFVHMRASVPNYMMPHEINKVDTFPVNSNGKIDRIKLKERL